MRRNDVILIIVIVMLAIGGLTAFFITPSDPGDIAVVSYRDGRYEQEILRIDLRDGRYETLDENFVYRSDIDEEDPVLKRCFKEGEDVYCVLGDQGVVVIEYANGKVRVVEETSDYNLCRYQGDDDGFTNSPSRPLICLPNRITVRILARERDETIDFES